MLETRSREESSEYSVICDDEEINESVLKCNFFTE